MLPPSRVPPSLTFAPVRRVRADDLTADDVEHLFGGATPLVIEGLEANWPEAFRDGEIRDLALFRKDRPNSVYVDGKQVFEVTTETFLENVEANRNVRVFGIGMKPDVDAALKSPQWLFDRLDAAKLYRYDDPRPVCFIGGGGAITPLHHDFEQNINWHIVMAGERPVFLWTFEESGRLFKLPIIGLSLISISGGLIDHRLARGYKTVLKKGDLLFMPSKCWHQIEYPTPSMAATFAFHANPDEKAEGTATGHFWFGFMSLFQAVFRGRPLALATLPLMTPFFLFSTLFIPANLVASLLPGRARTGATRAVALTERATYRLYRPLMTFCRRKFWVGY